MFNLDLYPNQYLSGEATQEEQLLDDLQRQILALRNQHLLQTRRAGISIAEVQNQGIRITFNRFSSERPVVINSTYNVSNVTNVTKVVAPSAPLAVAPPPKTPQPAPPPVRQVIKLGKAFIGGGAERGSHDLVDKFTFNGMTCRPAGFTLATRRQRHAGMASWRYGYWTGGQAGGNITSRRNDMESVNLTTEAKRTISATLAASQVYCSAAYNPRTAYIAGNYSPLGNVVTKFNMVAETTSTNGSSLSNARGGAVAISFSGQGFFASGFNSTRGIDKINFANDSVTAIAAQLSVIRIRGGGFSNHGRGYFCGGDTDGAGGANSNSVDRFRNSNESIVLLSQQLDTGLGLTEGLEGDIHGYLFGGWRRASQIRHMRFVNESWYTTGAALSRGGATAVPAGRKR